MAGDTRADGLGFTALLPKARFIIRKFNKRILIEKGDIVVVTKSNANDKKEYILHKFNNEQTNNLISEFKISNVLINYYNNITNISNTSNEDILDNLDFNITNTSNEDILDFSN